MIASFVKAIKWLILTNLYISLAAVCFQLVIVLLVDHLDSWNWMMSVHTFFSTLMVYQFSRWIFQRNIKEGDYRKDGIYEWHDNHPNFTITTVLISGIIAVATLYFLKWQTILILAGLGVLSILYPVQLKFGGREYGLRSIPFAKIFLIAVVWAGMSVWVPLSELNYPPFEHLDRFAFHVLFILFITLPFDMVDLKNDRITSLQTIPSWLGLKVTKALILLMAVLLIVYEVLRMVYVGPLIEAYLVGYIILIVALGIIASRVDENESKLKVMIIFDGSMIVLFLITLILHQYG